MRHLISGADCAIAGEATAATAAPLAETFKKSRRFIQTSPWASDIPLFLQLLWSGFEHRPQVALAGALTRKWSCKKGNKGMTALIKRKSNEPGKQAQAAAITP
jgi:hypothetical protein